MYLIVNKSLLFHLTQTANRSKRARQVQRIRRWPRRIVAQRTYVRVDLMRCYHRAATITIPHPQLNECSFSIYELVVLSSSSHFVLAVDIMKKHFTIELSMKLVQRVQLSSTRMEIVELCNYFAYTLFLVRSLCAIPFYDC